MDATLIVRGRTVGEWGDLGVRQDPSDAVMKQEARSKLGQVRLVKLLIRVSYRSSWAWNILKESLDSTWVDAKLWALLIKTQVTTVHLIAEQDMKLKTRGDKLKMKMKHRDDGKLWVKKSILFDRKKSLC